MDIVVLFNMANSAVLSMQKVRIARNFFDTPIRMIAPMIYFKNSGCPRNLLLIDTYKAINKGDGSESCRVVEIVLSLKIDCLGRHNSTRVET